MRQAGEGLSSEELVELLDQALRAVWSVARPNISEATLAAVLDRALVNTADEYPGLPRVTIETDAADFSALRAAAPRLKRDELARAIEFLLTDFMAILGNLTAEIMTSSLQQKLSSVRLRRRGGDSGGRGNR